MDIHIKYKRAHSGFFISQVVEFPFIIEKSSTLDGIREESLDGLNTYFKTFPDKEVPIEKIYLERDDLLGR